MGASWTWTGSEHAWRHGDVASRRRISLAESAIIDLESILEWHAKQGVPGSGVRTVDRVLASIEQLWDVPERGRLVPEFERSQLGELILPPYRVVRV